MQLLARHELQEAKRERDELLKHAEMEAKAIRDAAEGKAAALSEKANADASRVRAEAEAAARDASAKAERAAFEVSQAVRCVFIALSSGDVLYGGLPCGDLFLGGEVQVWSVQVCIPSTQNSHQHPSIMQSICMKGLVQAHRSLVWLPAIRKDSVIST